MNTPDREVFEHWFATEQMPGSELSYDNRRALISIYANENGYSGDYSDLHKAWTIWNAAFKLQATSAQPQQVAQAQIPKSETLPADKITVSKEPLQTVLTALVSDGHFIRELQATRLPSAIFPDNPINVLVAEFNASGGQK